MEKFDFFGTLAPKSSETGESSSSPVHVFGPVPFHGSDQPPNALQTLTHSPCPLVAMPDLSTVCLPPFPELPVDAAGDLADDHAGDAAAASIDAAPASSSASVEDGGGGPLTACKAAGSQCAASS